MTALIAVEWSQGIEDAWSDVASFVPKFIGFLVILLIGYFVAKLIAKAVGAILERVGFDRAVERGGIKKALDRSKYDACDILAKIVFYALFLIVLQMAFGVFGPNPISDLLEGVIAYLPKVIAAILIIVIASAIAAAARELIDASLGGLCYGRRWPTPPASPSSSSASSPPSTSCRSPRPSSPGCSTPCWRSSSARRSSPSAAAASARCAPAGRTPSPSTTRRSRRCNARPRAPRTASPPAPSSAPTRPAALQRDQRGWCHLDPLTPRTERPSPTPSPTKEVRHMTNDLSTTTVPRSPTSSTATPSTPTATRSAPSSTSTSTTTPASPSGWPSPPACSAPRSASCRSPARHSSATTSSRYTKDQVKDAPNADADGQLTPDEEAALYAHYGRTAAGTATAGDRHASTGGDERDDTSRPERRRDDPLRGGARRRQRRPARPGGPGCASGSRPRTSR